MNYKNKILVWIFIVFYSTGSILSQSDTIVPNDQERIAFNPDIEYDTYADTRDKREYKTVKIGDQLWIAENMKYMPLVHPVKMVSQKWPVYYVYGYAGNDLDSAKLTDNFKVYGVLYNWHAAKRACPEGWHLPSFEEWEELFNHLGWVSVAGNKMKETGTKHWKINDKHVTNSSGFTALPGGSIMHNGDQDNFGKKANFWGTKIRGADNIHVISLSNYSSWAEESYMPQNTGISVRCIKD